MTLLFGGVALGYSLLVEPTYRAEATLLFEEPASRADELGAVSIPNFTAQERAAIGADVVTRPQIERKVKRRLHLRDLDADVSTATQARSNLVVVTADAHDAKRAARVANAYAVETAKTLRSEYRREIKTQLRAARPLFRRLRRAINEVVVGQVLQLRTRLEALEKLGRPVLVERRAEVPTEAASPQTVRNTLLGLLVGLTLGLVAAFVRNNVDRRLKDLREVADAADLPLVGRIRDEALGRVDLSSLRGLNGADGLDLESIRIVRTNLDFLDLGRRPSTVLVTSPLAEEGKSTVASGLAVANALGGRSTLLVECDMRRPVLAKRLGIKPAPGLSDFLAGKAEGQEIVQPVSLGLGSGSSGGRPADGTSEYASLLNCVTAGTARERPADMLGSPAFADFLATACRVYDMVVLDASPLLPVVDTLELVPHADRVLICVRARQTTHEQLVAAREALANLPSIPTGVIVTGVRKGDELDYRYYGKAYAALEPAAEA